MKIVIIAVIFCITGNPCVWRYHTGRNACASSDYANVSAQCACAGNAYADVNNQCACASSENTIVSAKNANVNNVSANVRCQCVSVKCNCVSASAQCVAVRCRNAKTKASFKEKYIILQTNNNHFKKINL